MQIGKLNISETLQDWSCNSACSPSQHCRLPRCTNVLFPNTFSGSGTVRTSEPHLIYIMPRGRRSSTSASLAINRAVGRKRGNLATEKGFIINYNVACAFRLIKVCVSETKMSHTIVVCRFLNGQIHSKYIYFIITLFLKRFFVQIAGSSSRDSKPW